MSVLFMTLFLIVLLVCYYGSNVIAGSNCFGQIYMTGKQKLSVKNSKNAAPTKQRICGLNRVKIVVSGRARFERIKYFFVKIDEWIFIRMIRGVNGCAGNKDQPLSK